MHFVVYSNAILGYIVSKEGKLLSPKKNSTIVNMQPPLETPKDIQVFNNMAQFYFCFIQNFAFIWSWPQSLSFLKMSRYLIGLQNVKLHVGPYKIGTWMPQSWLLQGGIWNLIYT